MRPSINTLRMNRLAALPVPSVIAMDAVFEESKHPRNHGKFAHTPGAGGAVHPPGGRRTNAPKIGAHPTYKTKKPSAGAQALVEGFNNEAKRAAALLEAAKKRAEETQAAYRDVMERSRRGGMSSSEGNAGFARVKRAFKDAWADYTTLKNENAAHADDPVLNDLDIISPRKRPRPILDIGGEEPID